MSTCVTVKTLQGKLHTVPVEPLDTIAHLKARLESITGDPVSCQKLFSSGKTMADDCVVEQCGFKEKDFLVLMVSKTPGSISRAPVSSSTSTSTFAAPTFASISEISTPAFTLDPAISTPSSPDLAPPVSVPTSPELASQPPTRFTATTARTTPAFEQSSTGPSLVGMQTAFAVGPPSKNAIARLKDMGFSEDNIRPALCTAYNSPDRAAEFLMSDEIPEDPEAESLQQSITAIQAAPQESTTSSLSLVRQQLPSQASDLMQLFSQRGSAGSGLGSLGGLSGLGGLGGLGGLSGSGRQGSRSSFGTRPNPASSSNSNSNSQFAMFRQMARECPALLQPLIDRLRASNPGLAEAFQRDPEALTQMFEAFSDGEDGDDIPSFGQTGTNAGTRTRTITIGLTGEEIAGLERLLEMGFGRNKTIEAYMYCDKNEELAINYLLEYGDDDN